MYFTIKRLIAFLMVFISTNLTVADVSWESDDDTVSVAIPEDIESPYILIIRLPNAQQYMYRVPYSKLEQVRGSLINIDNMPDLGRNNVTASLFSLSDQVIAPSIEVSFPVYLLEDLIQDLPSISFRDV
jgi:hypothetical protein